MDTNATIVAPATLCRGEDSATGALRRQMPDHSLARDNGHDLIANRMDVPVEDMKFHAYLYSFHPMEEGP